MPRTSKEIEFWRFIANRLDRDERVVLLVVAESEGSSPGRPGYKMAVAADGELIGSIGGGVMEVNLVEQARRDLAANLLLKPTLIIQEHRKQSEHPSGMICSGSQTVIRVGLSGSDIESIQSVIGDLEAGNAPWFWITDEGMRTALDDIEQENTPLACFLRSSTHFSFTAKLGVRDQLYIIGGGHCALALSEVMSRLDFDVYVVDDRPGLNTVEKNSFAKQLFVVNDYELAHNILPDDDDLYIVVMTLGYTSDKVVIGKLLNRRTKYVGVLGSKAKMATLLRELAAEGYPRERLDAIRTPIGVPINSRTPEEIAVSIAAEIISVKNS